MFKKFDLSTILILIGVSILAISGLWGVFQYLVNYASTYWIICYLVVLLIIGGVIAKLISKFGNKPESDNA
ncbi:hypothetical protein phiOC_p192 [Ochrobactrum phage vB_OspM_OC]|nr:hypothetical protein phiOC_p192 [Ochrobactrum phage vB_OspM_OC]